MAPLGSDVACRVIWLLSGLTASIVRVASLPSRPVCGVMGTNNGARFTFATVSVTVSDEPISPSPAVKVTA